MTLFIIKFPQDKKSGVPFFEWTICMYTFWFIYGSFKHFTLFDFRLNFKLVLAEPLDDDKNSHVQNFLNHHGGPGLQHIGLSTSNVAETVQIMTDLGVQFRNPPPTYYKLVRKYFFAKSLDNKPQNKFS